MSIGTTSKPVNDMARLKAYRPPDATPETDDREANGEDIGDLAEEIARHLIGNHRAVLEFRRRLDEVSLNVVPSSGDDRHVDRWSDVLAEAIDLAGRAAAFAVCGANDYNVRQLAKPGVWFPNLGLDLGDVVVVIDADRDDPDPESVIVTYGPRSALVNSLCQ